MTKMSDLDHHAYNKLSLKFIDSYGQVLKTKPLKIRQLWKNTVKVSEILPPDS